MTVPRRVGRAPRGGCRRIAGWALAAAVSSSALAQAPPSAPAGAAASPRGEGQLRLRSLHLRPNIHDTIGLFVDVEPLGFTELDLTWSPHPGLGIELALTWPQTHRVRSAGFEVGRLRQLPPTLVLLRQFQAGPLRPYLGGGLSYTLVSNLRFAPEFSATLQPAVRNHSVGWVLAAGIDWALPGPWSLNVDAKRLQLKTDLGRVGDLPGDFRVRPVLWSLGLGWRF